MTRLRALWIAGTGIVAIAAAVIVVGAGDSNAAVHGDNIGGDKGGRAGVLDVSAWMSDDGAHVNMALSVNSGASANASFKDDTLYAFHINSTGDTAAQDVDVICKFNSNGTSVECWTQHRGVPHAH